MPSLRFHCQGPNPPASVSCQLSFTRPVLQTHVAFQQCLDLSLHNLSLSQEALVYRKASDPAGASPHEVGLGVLISLHSFQQVLVVSLDVATLSLYCLLLALDHDSTWLVLPSVKELIASLCSEPAKYRRVTSGAPSLIIRCTINKDLNTIVQVESRSRSWRVRKISATPVSPP